MRGRATSWAVVAVGGLLVVGASAWTSVGQTPTALPNARGAGPQTVVGGGTLNGETVSRADESVGSATPFQVLTFENYRLEVRERSMAGKSGEGETDAKDGNGKNQAEQVTRVESKEKRQLAVRLRSKIVHPAPQIRHATTEYRATFPGFNPLELQILAVLDLPVRDWEFNESPLRDVARVIERQFQIPVEIDRRRLEDFGLDIDTPVAFWASDVSLRSALNRVLDPLDLAYLIENEVLLITTREKAEEHFVVGLYPLPACAVHDELVALIQSTVAADSWDVVGGPGAIRPLVSANELAISQTMDVHEEIQAFVSSLDAALIPEKKAAGVVPMRAYSIRNPQVLADLATQLPALCSAALGEATDAAARVYPLGGMLIVQSASRPFQIYAAEVVRAVNGVEIAEEEVLQGSPDFDYGMGMIPFGGGGFCWVAREVYGSHDPRWIVFRAWLLHEAPTWLREGYARHGESFAAWLKEHPALKLILRPLMDTVVSGAASR